MATTLLRSPDRPGCELRKLVNRSFFSSHWGSCLFSDSTKGWLLLIHEKNKPAILRLAVEWLKCHQTGKYGRWCSLLTLSGAGVPFLPPAPVPPVPCRTSSRCHVLRRALRVLRWATQTSMVNAKRKPSLRGQQDRKRPVVASRWVWWVQITLLWPPPPARGARLVLWVCMVKLRP